MLATTAIAFAARRSCRRRHRTQLRHHRDREGRRPEADVGAVPRRHVQGSRREGQRLLSRPTTPESSRRSASTRCRSPGTATSRRSTRSIAPAARSSCSSSTSTAPRATTRTSSPTRTAESRRSTRCSRTARTIRSASATRSRPPARWCRRTTSSRMNNLDPKTHFKVMRSSNHEGNFLAVLNRQVDVATSNSEMTEKMKEKSPEKMEQIRIVWTSPLIPRDPLVWRKDLPADVKKKVQDFMVGYGKDARGEGDPEEHVSAGRLQGLDRRAAAADPPARALQGPQEVRERRQPGGRRASRRSSPRSTSSSPSWPSR